MRKKPEIPRAIELPNGNERRQHQDIPFPGDAFVSGDAHERKQATLEFLPWERRAFAPFSEQLSWKRQAVKHLSVHPRRSPNDSDTVFGLLSQWTQSEGDRAQTQEAAYTSLMLPVPQHKLAVCLGLCVMFSNVCPSGSRQISGGCWNHASGVLRRHLSVQRLRPLLEKSHLQGHLQTGQWRSRRLQVTLVHIKADTITTSFPHDYSFEWMTFTLSDHAEGLLLIHIQKICWIIDIEKWSSHSFTHIIANPK